MNIDETAYLLQSPENASRLMQGIKDHENCLGKEKDLIEANYENLDSLTKEDYQKHFKQKIKANNKNKF